MASSKNLFLLLALSFALALLVSSQVAASEESLKTNGVEEVKYVGRGGVTYPAAACPCGCCRKGCLRCCGSAHEGHGGGTYPAAGCPYGSYLRGCVRCYRSAHEC